MICSIVAIAIIIYYIDLHCIGVILEMSRTNAFCILEVLELFIIVDRFWVRLHLKDNAPI